MKIFKKNKNCSGFTLIELIVYVGLAALVIVSTTLFILDIIGGKVKSEVIQEVQQNARLALERITQEIHGAQSINLGSSSFGVNLASSPGSKLSLDMREAALDPTEFDVASGILRIRQGASGPDPLTSDEIEITNLTFHNLTSPNGRTENIRVSLSLEYVNPGEISQWETSLTLETTVELMDR